MRSKALWIGVLLVIIVGLYACYRKGPQKMLAWRLSRADRAIVSYNMGGGYKASMPLTTEETKRLVQALPKGERTSRYVEATTDIPIEFYKGTNLLGILRSAGGGKLFCTAHAVYEERTGVLESFFLRVRAQADSATPDVGP